MFACLQWAVIVSDGASPNPFALKSKFTPAIPIEPLVHVPPERMEGSNLSLDKTDKEVSAYNKVLELLANDQTYQKEVNLGKRIAFYRLGKELGSGNFSKVRMGVHVLTKEKVAVKIMERTKMDQKAQRLLAREIQNMEEMHHPNIVRLFEVVETLSKMYLVMEFAGGGELYNYVLEREKLDENEAKKIYAQIVAAVLHMHEKCIIHRDIKSENVFFAGPGWVKLGDFGFSVEIDPGQSLNTFCGSPPYAAPELFKDTEYQGEYVDVWALGILLYFMLTGNTPFRGDTVSELKRQILDGYFTIPETVSTFGQDIINGILRMEPLSRYTFAEIQSHYWLTNTNFPDSYVQCSTVPNEEELKTNTVAPKVWNKIHEYGITPEMMREAAAKGAKNSIIGTYRIVLYQVQSVDIEIINNKLDQNQNNNANDENSLDKSNRKSRLCTIL